ncbi:isochorismatase [Fructilactobacillus lindneri]|uniref:Pyrazinamidase nicotinamidase n=2 Tax=Fructilactobacillus lindneri TaxID=53444 RepID=A0A0R2JN86_9LACO|nr:isochorismatase family cysteine hydrolase [Fructilactobacillus lindneri]ANZ57895.1 isochorismatase [Fructilactobacillus lindneri]ANZ59164.1 isochorismatase [Fructilactobacillus lindneri]KRN78639.1 pyrazinamidase nicotinamidase [Fructilactobacillus lindneri DSM 20690 = JCM 11027]POG98214.1 isochorismatase [Fructilactobacillus lindneri]POH01669.1 isochorismatase [Fructilactobacillus lindneri]
MNKKALLIIDYTNDFVAENGALTLGKAGQACESEIIKLAEEFKNNGDLVILPTDVHQKDDSYHPETKLFPPHNIRNSWGRKLYGNLNQWYENHKHLENVWLMDKTRYSSFVGTDLDLILREHHIDTLHLVGVSSDICVLHTAISAYNLNYELVIHENAIASFDPKNQQFALNHFKNVLGAKIVK